MPPMEVGALANATKSKDPDVSDSNYTLVVNKKSNQGLKFDIAREKET